ncbi:MAG: hypothetical protein NTX28_05425 [Novosphingobium sp.]|nr:hypothetical protein [Novosphingobium sp.]
MQSAARPLEEVFEALSWALDDLDHHGEAMAALHLAMAVDCLRACLVPEAEQIRGAHLKLVVSS